MYFGYKLDNPHDKELLERVCDMSPQEWDTALKLAEQCETKVGRDVLKRIASHLYHITEFQAGME